MSYKSHILPHCRHFNNSSCVGSRGVPICATSDSLLLMARNRNRDRRADRMEALTR